MNFKMTNIFAQIFLILAVINETFGSCYFPAAFQGEYVTQAIMSGVPTISYSSLTILFDSVPVWGVCHKRIGNNVILMDDTGGLTCFKCFNIVLRSSNVLQIHTSALDKCYTTEERAVADCPSDMTIREKRAREIMLYRTKGFMGEPAVSPTFCPINGAYTFTYSVNDGTENSLECSGKSSEISDCHYGFGFNLKFRGCSFGNMEMAFHCLGDWEGPNGQRYVALMDTQATSQHGDDTRPRYRCALYEENENNGEIHLALSSDSTCTNHLRSATKGYETLTLKPRPQKPWPLAVQEKGKTCVLPDWSQGKWEHLHIQEGTLFLKDHHTFKTYSAKCVNPKVWVHEDRFLLYSRTHCGDEHYRCVWLKNRGDNTLEFQIGLHTSAAYNETLCDDENFQDRTWTTQGRIDLTEATPYPIDGEYTGVIPDTEGLCAKLYSDCNNPEIMFYTIFNCFNRSEVFEEREYQCVGQWLEDGLIYTYTERRDMIGYECFVGLITSKGDIYLREAGHNCERGQDPLRDGMRLTQVSKCFGSYHPRMHWQSATPPLLTPSSSSSSKPRKITALPRWREREMSNDIDSGTSHPIVEKIILLASFIVHVLAFSLRSATG